MNVSCFYRGAQNLKRLVLIFKLASLVLTSNHYARGKVSNTDCGFGFVNFLPARARRTVINETELGGLKEVVFNVTGKDAYKQLKFESGRFCLLATAKF